MADLGPPQHTVALTTVGTLTSPSEGDTKSPPDNHKESPCTLEAGVETGLTREDGSYNANLADERELVTHVISVDDDPSLNPWTFRSFIIGLGLSAFGGALAEIYYFKPIPLFVSLIFLAIISYIMGVAMETFIPRWGFFRYLNPHPFNHKENAFIIIMASAAATAALATEVLAVQRLYYNITPNPATSIFLLLSSQLLGYGIGGMMRSILLYPSTMLYPTIIPLIAMFDAFFRSENTARRKLRVFYMAFTGIFIWELFPEWIFPMLTGFSIMCLAAPNSTTVSHLFGGSNGNEGIGILSLCLDWQYVSAVNPMAIPLKVTFSGAIGYVISIILIVSVYFGNVWNAQDFPLFSQLLFYENGTIYDQTLIMNGNFEVDPTLVAAQGLPSFASSWVISLIGTNLGIGSTITHFLLWNYDDFRPAWSWIRLDALRKVLVEFNWKFWQNNGMRQHAEADKDLDPHYAQMLKYPDTPNSWYFLLMLFSFAVALIVNGKSDSTLPWWSLFIATAIATVFILFMVALYAVSGLPFPLQSFVQMVGGYLHPGKPMANMYFVLYSSNIASQAQLLLRDLKIAQYSKLPPQAAFTAQLIGTIFGAFLNYVLMNSIVTNQREILLSVQGTNVWSGEQAQIYNSQAITWGGLSNQLFSAGKKYQWVSYAYIIGLLAPLPFWIIHRYWPKLRANFISTPFISVGILSLARGDISSVFFSYFIVGFYSQWYMRTRHPRWFQRYNYIVGAALDGGAQVMVFILTFAVFGAAGNSHLFPEWWGANHSGNYDRCKRLN